MQQKPAFICDYCGTLSLHAPYIKGHEKRCRMNPSQKACKSCRWWFKNRPEYGTKFSEDNTAKHFLPFCSNPDEDYSFKEEWHYGDFAPLDEWNEIQKDCEGWATILQKERNDHERLKREVRERYNREHDEFMDSLGMRD
jgi:hypothetical protein